MLKVEESKIDVGTPWTDDKLERQKTADRLTKIIEDQGAPFVISLDGRWGTGKTFLLKRWQRELENSGFQAIYFNAWEDDFCDDPLLAIIGQLTEHFQEGKLKTITARIGEVALPILTGRLLGVSLKKEDLNRRDLLADYRSQLKTKKEIRDRLTDLAGLVRKESGRPLVFIIDELDRCRPTFAIELLERVKHIFDVPNIVFVFGINRGELVKSLESVYGEIDAGVYLRRFFDMEFILPDADPVTFCQHLMTQFRLDKYFSDLSRVANSDIHAQDFRSLWETLPVILGHMGLSLRDMDYCARLIALAGKELKDRHTIFPAVLTLLVAVKVAEPDLYRRFVQGSARGAELIDYMNDQHRRHSASKPDSNRRDLEWVEAGIYFADDRMGPLEQLQLLRDGKELTQPDLLSVATRTMSMDDAASKRYVNRLHEAFEWFVNRSDSIRVDYHGSGAYLADLIDLYDGTLRR